MAEKIITFAATVSLVCLAIITVGAVILFTIVFVQILWDEVADRIASLNNKKEIRKDIMIQLEELRREGEKRKDVD